MRERKTLIIDSSLYKELSEIATKVKKDTISNQLEAAVRDYIAKEKGEIDEHIFSKIIIPIDKRISKLEETLNDLLFKLRLDMGTMINLMLPLSTDYITRTNKDILKMVLEQTDGTYDSARRKTVRQLEGKEGVKNAVC